MSDEPPRSHAPATEQGPPVPHVQGEGTPSYAYRLALVALGVVFGDIGTSPLYALRQCFHGIHGVPPTPQNIFGVLSLVFWSLIIVISIKYVMFVMRADNRGEGGILALLALIRPRQDQPRRSLLLGLALFGAALLYGDGMLTPAVTVLGAVEGLNVATPALARYVVPASVAILIAMFLVQHRGTDRIGRVFGPIMVLWFLAILVLGVAGIAREPSVLLAVNPLDGARFLVVNRWQGFLVLGAVFLVVTGGEALYADMGHFGRRPIRLAWFALVLPSLLTNYFGQGALLMRNAQAAANPFFFLVPSWGLYPMVVLATAAAIIASQALISGAFSLTRQAVQLGYSPRMKIIHTSEREIGQIYIKGVNFTLAVACVWLVVTFRSSDNLAAAYGIAVTMTMTITTILAYVVSRDRWRFSLPVAVMIAGGLLSIDLAFLAANIIKIEQGGWFPLTVGAVVFLLMSTWKRGRALLAARLRSGTLPTELFLKDIAHHPPHRVPGTAVFMTADPDGIPTVMLHHLKHNKVLHQRVVLTTITTEEVPAVSETQRLAVEELGHGVFRLIAHYGFMETPDVLNMLARAKTHGLEVKLSETTFYLGRETLFARGARGMARWRKQLFSLMSRNARGPADFFRLPPNRVVELGAQIEL